MECAGLQFPACPEAHAAFRHDSGTFHLSRGGLPRIRAFHYLPHRYPPAIGFVGMAWMVAQGIVERTGTCCHDNRNFNEKGFLTLGFNGSQPHISDWYTNNGSLYMASLAFLPLGLPADHPFWTDAPQAWTSKKSWGGEEFPKDHAYYE